MWRSAIALKYQAAVILLLGTASCGNQLYSRATITETQTGWSVVGKCVDTGCFRKDDFIIGENLTIQLRALNEIPDKFTDGLFLIRLGFPGNQTGKIEFDPSAASISLHTQIAVAKGVRCIGANFEPGFFKSVRGVQGFQRIVRGDSCYYLVFDLQLPSVDDVFVLQVGNVSVGGVPVNVPEIIFRPIEE